MKRNKIIDILCDEIEGKYSWDGPTCCISFEYANYIAENILTKLEELNLTIISEPMKSKLKAKDIAKVFNKNKDVLVAHESELCCNRGKQLSVVNQGVLRRLLEDLGFDGESINKVLFLN